jgi:hypothetical protein
VLLVMAGLAGFVPAQADAVGGPYSGWVNREDATAPATATTYSWSGPDTGLHLSAFNGQLAVYTDSTPGQSLGANFVPPAGQTLHAGATYRAEASWSDPIPGVGRLVLWRDNTMCGKTEDQLFANYMDDPNPVSGTFHISEIEYDGSGNVTRFAATYEMNCQYVGGQPGFEGSVAVNATAPLAAVPDEPSTPGPATGLYATNVGPDGGGTNSTTLSWTNPAGFGDVTIDMVQSTNVAKLPALLDSYFTRQYRGRASSYYDPHVEFMDTRTYRVVPRGPTGRLGPPSLVRVLGTRLDIPNPKQKIMIGQEVQFSGRLSESWDYVDPADVMKGPGLVGRTVVLCRQSSVNYVDGDCTVVDRTTTTTDGRFTLSASPMSNHLYNVVVPATRQMVGNSSRVINALVAPRTDLRSADSERVSAPTSVRRGSLIHFSTSRARAGSRGFVRLQRFDGQRWRTVATKLLGSGTRRLAVPYREYSRGLHAYRVVKPGDAHHINGHSRTVYIRVR